MFTRSERSEQTAVILPSWRPVPAERLALSPQSWRLVPLSLCVNSSLKTRSQLAARNVQTRYYILVMSAHTHTHRRAAWHPAETFSNGCQITASVVYCGSCIKTTAGSLPEKHLVGNRQLNSHHVARLSRAVITPIAPVLLLLLFLSDECEKIPSRPNSRLWKPFSKSSRLTRECCNPGKDGQKKCVLFSASTLILFWLVCVWAKNKTVRLSWHLARQDGLCSNHCL